MKTNNSTGARLRILSTINIVDVHLKRARNHKETKVEIPCKMQEKHADMLWHTSNLQLRRPHSNRIQNEL